MVDDAVVSVTGAGGGKHPCPRDDSPGHDHLDGWLVQSDAWMDRVGGWKRP